MSNAAKSKAVALAAKLAGQFATWGAHGIPVGPLAEEATSDLLGALLDVQDEQLATLQNIEKSVTQIGQDVSQLIEGPYRTAREMVERAMIPGRAADAVTEDLQLASAEFLRAAGQHPDATLPRASAYVETSFVQGMLGDEKAMRYYSDKAWKEAIAALMREAANANDVVHNSGEKTRHGRRSFWSHLDDREFMRRVSLLSWGEGGEDLAETFPEARAVQNVHDTKQQVDVYRDVAASLLGGPDVLPYHMVQAWLDQPMYTNVMVWKVYARNQIMSCRDELASLLTKAGINDHLYASSLWPDQTTWLDGLELEATDGEDPRAVAFGADVEKIFRYGINLSGPMRADIGRHVELA